MCRSRIASMCVKSFGIKYAINILNILVCSPLLDQTAISSSDVHSINKIDASVSLLGLEARSQKRADIRWRYAASGRSATEKATKCMIKQFAVAYVLIEYRNTEDSRY